MISNSVGQNSKKENKSYMGKIVQNYVYLHNTKERVLGSNVQRQA